MKIGITERGDAGIDFSWIGAKVDGMILITKKLSHQFIAAAARENAIVHATITGLGGTIIEPNVMPPGEAYEHFEDLVNEIGKERVVLRIDPIVPSRKEAAEKVFKDLRHFGTRVRISFMDNYTHVRGRFRRVKADLEPYDFHAPLAERIKMAKFFEGAEICGEPNMICSGCVSQRDLGILGLESGNGTKGQRLACCCLAEKTELLTSRKQCPHGCLYCYWK